MNRSVEIIAILRKGMEKMLKPALEKFMQDSGFVKESEFKKLEKRVEELEAKLNS